MMWNILFSWGGGANTWGPEKDDKFPTPNHWDGMLEVVGVTGVVHLGQIQSGLRSAIRIVQVEWKKNPAGRDMKKWSTVRRRTYSDLGGFGSAHCGVAKFLCSRVSVNGKQTCSCTKTKCTHPKQALGVYRFTLVDAKLNKVYSAWYKCATFSEIIKTIHGPFKIVKMQGPTKKFSKVL